jgi:hypothetical protein
MNDPLSYDPEDAFYGPLGELAKRHRDQIPLNLLPFHAMLMTAYGSLVGRRAMMQYCRDKHFGILFTAIVGDTGCGKGTSWNIIRDVAEKIDPSCGSRITTDVASAPGLIGLVRDASSRTEGKRVIEDPGVDDKRMLVVFEEMENLATSIARKGSTLDKVMNAAWDGKSLENNARNREKATDPHLSFICQITGEAFQSVVGTMRRGQGCVNGFFNRFITVAATKKRSLPRGGIMPDVTDLTDQLQNSLASLGQAVGSEPTVVTWHESTHDAWDELCEALDRDQGGLRARDKPKIMRVAMLNAISVGKRSVMLPHLVAAKAFVLQCNDSAASAYPQHRSAATTHLTTRVLAVATVTPKTLNDFHAGLHRKGYAASELHATLGELVAEGQLAQTTVPSKKGDPLPAWSLALSEAPPAEDVPPENKDPLPDGMVEVEGVRLQRGACIEAKRDVAAFTFAGESTNVVCGKVGYLAAPAPNMPKERQDAAHDRLEQHPKHVAAIFDGEVLFVLWEALRLVKEPVAA